MVKENSKKEAKERKNNNPILPEEFSSVIPDLTDDGDLFSFKLPKTEHWTLREKFRTSVSWHIPTKSLLYLLKEYSPIVSIASGFAYTESLANNIGADVIATDICPNEKNKWCIGGKFFTNVEKLPAVKAVKKYADRNVFMAWPPYDEPMAFQVAKNMKKGRYLIYVGERKGGCTGDDAFFEYLYKNFEEIDIESTIPVWFGLHDKLLLFVKK